MKQLLKVSIRQQAIILPGTMGEKAFSIDTAVLIANLVKLGYGVEENLLHALSTTTAAVQEDILEVLREVTGMNKNWTPLVKGWDVPTVENIFGKKGTLLQCGHIIPPYTFPLERYNGCPFCGTPFEIGETAYTGQGYRLKVLHLWTIQDAKAFLTDLLTSKTALDATQADSLKILLNAFPLPVVTIGMKETRMLVIDILVAQQRAASAQILFSSPVDVMRYLWYKHTGSLQIIEPKVIVKRRARNNKHIHKAQNKSAVEKLLSDATLKLKYSRQECFMVASWLNNLEMDVEHMCEAMHPKRAMWVRFIRALRLAEYSKRAGFEKLKELMEYFYHEAYTVWQGRIDNYRLKFDAEKTMLLLKQRPGLFARSLFANILWFGHEVTLPAFAEVTDKIPARLIISLGMYAKNYFDAGGNRLVRPLGGVSKTIPANKLLSVYSESDLTNMQEEVERMALSVMSNRFSVMENEHTSMYIDPTLFKLPLAISDRSETVQDIPVALQGTRFLVEGDTVRLFMQWGVGLKAQHLDMDLSCIIAYEDKTERCSFQSLSPVGCKHSGDIRSIPSMVGTAEYIDLDLKVLRKAGAKYVTFTCNAYSCGGLTPNLVVGWMNSLFPMKVSEKTGVAYDPSCVQHQVRIVNDVSKGLVFGVLDIAAHEIIWMEMPFDGQIAGDLSMMNVKQLMKRLNSKFTVGELLTIKAQAQGLVLTDTAIADEVYTVEWAKNTAAVTQLLVD